ncbi:hypothetical protein APE_1979a [Aeropyrum pernix K1]|uniref:Uncharacterized protein n=1 Tax=Aeropyrum pernix (strain ATCC 700893 / DSM 11879 / JCM 9820 / NBRC 100138 / K1) TaxID=272557 RepID=Q05DY9_AERPE|nr:hypothetical protein [Aeropyrum pernix]BAF34812.1 hypothetical protein APE_1979a [Aeropyrum pernix K1]
MAAVSPRRIVAEKLLLTAAIVVAGLAIVLVADSRGSLPLMVVGLVVIALAPFLSLAVVVARFRRAVRGGKRG